VTGQGMIRVRGTYDFWRTKNLPVDGTIILGREDRRKVLQKRKIGYKLSMPVDRP